MLFFFLPFLILSYSRFVSHFYIIVRQGFISVKHYRGLFYCYLTVLYKYINIIIIWCKFFFLFVGRGPTTWPANACLQIMVCSCTMSYNCVWLQIIFCVNEVTLFSFLQPLLHVRLWLRKFWCFGLGVVHGRRSLTRGGRTWRFDCILYTPCPNNYYLNINNYNDA